MFEEYSKIFIHSTSKNMKMFYMCSCILPVVLLSSGHPGLSLPFPSWETPSHLCLAWSPRGSCPTVHTAGKMFFVTFCESFICAQHYF